jgi:hypothetical protein
MNETDIKDKRGNIIISPGLKVRHKDSQFEYTVDQVLQEPDGEITVILAAPEEPRFEPAGKEAVLTDKRNITVEDMKALYEADPISSLESLYYFPAQEEEESEEDLLAVPAKEFEKEYEVK